MFGYEYEIVREFPQYFLDYQENDGTNERWTDRFISSSGDWSGNLYDFYYKALNRLSQDIKVPFRIDETATRIDETPVHRALGEALANALVNANYYGRMGLVLKQWPGVITIANPGGFRIPFEKALKGGFSDPRNGTILKLFNMLGVGERSGSGIPKVFAVWKEEKWETPKYEEEFNPDRTILTLPISNSSTNDFVENLAENLAVKLSEKQKEVLSMISDDSSISMEEMAKRLDVTRQAISQRLKTLSGKNIIRRVGPDKGGSWEIISPNKK
jgi:predicted HTH transcriptional regulator